MRIESISITNTAILLKSNLQTQYSSHQNDVIIHRNRETKFIIHIEAQKTLHNKSKFKRKNVAAIIILDLKLYYRETGTA